MASETIRACLLRQAQELRAQLPRHLAAVTATYLEYEADRIDSEADEPCTSRRLGVNGVCHCLVSRHRLNPSSASPAHGAAANDTAGCEPIAC